MTDQSHIAKKLKAARDHRGLSLKEVAHETRIPVTTLSALEEHDYTHFSSPTYAKSFLDQYANFLKVDAHEFIDELESSGAIPELEDITYLDSKNSSSPQRSSPKIPRTLGSSQRNRSQLSQPLLITLITGLIIAAGIWGSVIVEKKLNTDPATPANTAKVPQTDPQKSANPPPNSPSAEIASSPNKAPSSEKNRPPRSISSKHSAPPNDDEDDLDGPVYIFPEHKAPPRAIIVDEDE